MSSWFARTFSSEEIFLCKEEVAKPPFSCNVSQARLCEIRFVVKFDKQRKKKKVKLSRLWKCVQETAAVRETTDYWQWFAELLLHEHSNFGCLVALKSRRFFFRRHSCHVSVWTVMGQSCLPGMVAVRPSLLVSEIFWHSIVEKFLPSRKVLCNRDSKSVLVCWFSIFTVVANKRRRGWAA